MKDKSKNINILWCIIGIISGLILIIIGIVFLLKFKNATFYGYISRLGTATFGADFYTEIYESTTFAANALKETYEMINTYFGTFLIFIGVVDICIFGSKTNHK